MTYRTDGNTHYALLQARIVSVCLYVCAGHARDERIARTDDAGKSTKVISSLGFGGARARVQKGGSVCRRGYLCYMY